MKIEMINKKTGKKKILYNAEHISFITTKTCGFFDIDFTKYNIENWEIEFIHEEV